MRVFDQAIRKIAQEHSETVHEPIFRPGSAYMFYKKINSQMLIVKNLQDTVLITVKSRGKVRSETKVQRSSMELYLKDILNKERYGL